MARVISGEVKEIIDTDIDVGPFVKAANLVVTEVLGSTSLSDDLLKEIERWFSAHLVAIRDQKPARERVDDTEVYYQGETGFGLDSTLYGQQVVLLDTTGRMKNIGKKSVVFNAIDLDLSDNY